MLHFEDVAAPPQTGWLQHLIDAFPEDAESFDLSGYASGGICIFLSVLPSSNALPARQQVADILRHIGGEVLAGRTVFSMDAARFGSEAIRRLAMVVAEVVIDGRSRDFPLFAASREIEGQVEIWATSGFCDLVLGRWNSWDAGNGEAGRAVSSHTEPDAAPWELLDGGEAEVPEPPRFAEASAVHGSPSRSPGRRALAQELAGRETGDSSAASRSERGAGGGVSVQYTARIFSSL